MLSNGSMTMGFPRSSRRSDPWHRSIMSAKPWCLTVGATTLPPVPEASRSTPPPQGIVANAAPSVASLRVLLSAVPHVDIICVSLP